MLHDEPKTCSLPSTSSSIAGLSHNRMTRSTSGKVENSPSPAASATLIRQSNRSPGGSAAFSRVRPPPLLPHEDDGGSANRSTVTPTTRRCVRCRCDARGFRDRARVARRCRKPRVAAYARPERDDATRSVQRRGFRSPRRRAGGRDRRAPADRRRRVAGTCLARPASAEPISLGAFDALRLNDSHRLWISGAGPVAVISVLRARESCLR